MNATGKLSFCLGKRTAYRGTPQKNELTTITVRLVHVGLDGLKVDPFFNIDLNKFPTGSARGHDMLIN
jgi:hypothetical protein